MKYNSINKTPEIIKEVNEIGNAISEGNFNVKILGKFFDDMKIRSYSYDYNMQKELVQLYHKKVYLKDARNYMLKGVWSQTLDRVYEFSIMHQFVDNKERERYKRSDIFRKYVKPEVINGYRNFFLYNLLVFSHNKLLTDYRIKAYNDRVDICFKKGTLYKKGYDELDIYFIPDSLISIVENMNYLAISDGNKFNTDLIISKPYMAPIKKYFGFWVSKNDNTYRMIHHISYDQKKDEMIIDDVGCRPTEIYNYKLVLVGANRIHDYVDYPKDTKWIEFVDHLMPLPKDNIMVFIKKGIDYIINDGSVELTEYYPNFFKITNPDNYDIRFIEMYEDSTQNEHITFQNQLARYITAMKESDDYTPENHCDLAKNFKPLEWDYNIDDFIKKHPYNTLNFNDLWDSYRYKDQTIARTVKQWYYMYFQYQVRTYGFLSSWYHRIADYDNMDDKIRTDTSIEVEGNIDYIVRFSNPQYVFSYENSTRNGTVNSFAFYIDGKYTLPTKIVIYNGFQYVYFPVSKIHHDSIIEVERFDSNAFSKKVKLPREGIEFPLNTVVQYDTVANNIFLVGKYGKYLTKNDVYVAIIDPELGEIPVDLETSVFIVVHTAKLKIIPRENFTDDEILICMNDKTYQFRARETGRDFFDYEPDEITLNASHYVRRVNKNLIPRLRIFTSDGRLISKDAYRVLKHDNFYDEVRFNIPIYHNSDKWFLVAYVGYNERLIYHRDVIPKNGLIQLSGKITRPVNLKYHDIYLDGYRLTKYDIDFITPFTFAIKNLAKFDTLNNLEIYEKTHNNDKYVSYAYDEKSQFIEDKLFDEDSPFRDNIESHLSDYTPTGETLPSDNDRDWWSSFFDEYAMYHFLNGDERRDLEKYRNIFDEESGRVILDADDRVKYENDIKYTYFFDHDKSIELYGDDLEKYPKPKIVDYEDDIKVDETIKVPEEEYRQYGYFTTDDNYRRKYDPPFKFEPDRKIETEDPDNKERTTERFVPDSYYDRHDIKFRVPNNGEDIEYEISDENKEKLFDPLVYQNPDEGKTIHNVENITETVEYDTDDNDNKLTLAPITFKNDENSLDKVVIKYKHSTKDDK